LAVCEAPAIAAIDFVRQKLQPSRGAVCGTWGGRTVVFERGIDTNRATRLATGGWCGALLACSAAFLASAPAAAAANNGTFTMEQVIAYQFVPEIEAAQ